MDEAAPKPAPPPDPIRLIVRSWRGPFAGAGTVTLPACTTLFANETPEAMALAGASADPWRAETGLTAAGALRAETPGGPLTPGTSRAVVLTGTVPARPGTYSSKCRILPAPGPVLTVTAVVAASTVWGVLCMLLGLSLVNILAGLAGESETQAKLFDVLQARQAAHTWLEPHPVSDSRMEDVAEMERNFDRAMNILRQPRSASLVDHRVQEASVPLQAAMDQDVAIRKALQGRSAVAALVDDLNKEWTSLQAELRHFDVVPALDGTPMAGFSGQLTRLFERHNHERVTLPARYASAKLEAQLIQVRLTMAAGEGVHARELAGIAEIWLRRSARELLDGQRQSERLAVQAESLLSIDGMIRSGVDAPGFPPDQSSVTLERLDKAEALLDDHAGLAEFQSVAHSMQLLATLHEIVIDAALQVRMIEMIKLADAETPWAEVEAAVALASADPDHSSASKIRHLREILAVWDRLIQGIQVEEAKPALEAARRGVLAAVDAGDLPQVPPTYRALTTAWADYGVARAKDAADRAQKPDCERYVARIRNQLAVTGHALRWAEPGPASTKLDQELGRIEVALNGQPEAHRCMERLFQLDQDAGRLADAINGKAALEAIAPGSIVKATTATGAVPRALTLEITPQDETERTVGRRIGFMVRQMGDDWRQGVPLRLDFGDGSPPVTYTAEKWRQMGVEHTYALPGSVIAQIVTIGEFGAEGARPPMGQGEVTLAIGPAPDASARALADRFLSARFALALLIALVAYYWRFHARPIVFGARGYDYVEAFALGFAVNAAVAELPAAIAKFLPG